MLEIKSGPNRIESDASEPLKICFVCTGNTCRSPMAAAVLNHLGKGGYRACSAGISAVTGDFISANAVKALKEAGIDSTPENDYEKHRAIQINEELMERCDKIVAISQRHMMALIYAFPHMADKITVMSRDISDPFMGSEQVYKDCLAQITDCIRESFAV